LFEKADWGFLLQQLTRAIEINPRNDSALNWRGLAYFSVGDVDKSEADFRACIDFSPLSAPCKENLIMVLAGQRRDEEAYAQFLSALDHGIAKPREADLALLARMGEKTVFKLITNSEDLLFGWNEHEALYHAFRNPDGDHQKLIRSMENFFALHPERRNWTLKIARPYLGNLSFGALANRTRSCARPKNSALSSDIPAFWITGCKMNFRHNVAPSATVILSATN
jgi:tetratricopeptide (TPR) repeat protein